MSSGFALLFVLLLLALPPVRVRLQVALGQPIAIATIHQNPFLAGITVTVEGIVGDRVPLVGGQIVELQDGSGSLWVVSADTTRQPGESARIRGNVQVEAFDTDAIPAEVYLVERLPDIPSPLSIP